MTTEPGDEQTVLAAAIAASGGSRDKASHWFFHEPLDAFDQKTAAKLVAEGRAKDVLAYIEYLEAGPAG